MKICRTIAVLTVTSGCAIQGAALAQTSQIYDEFSTDGGATWSANASVLPGSTVHVRVRVTLVGATALGLAGLTMQPKLEGWRPDLGDTVVPFTYPGLSMNPYDPMYGTPVAETSYDGRNVLDNGSSTGRMFPFGAGGQGLASAGGLLTAFNDPGNVLRFAASKNTTPTTNVAWGVAISQWPQMGLSPTDPYYASAFFNSSPDVVVFRYAFTLGGDATPRDLSATIPVGLISGNVAKWYTASNGTAVLTTPAVVSTSSVYPGGLHVVPAPGASGLALIGLAALTRRRR